MMPDREKVIKGCENWVNNHKDEDLLLAYSSVVELLALLKEQEAVEPKKIKRYNPPIFTLYEYECEKCKSPMMNKQPFCMGCGRSVRWK